MAKFFGKKRSDGKLVVGGDPMQYIMPYVMKGRNESAIYFKKTVNIENIREYNKSKRKEGIRITLFNIVVAALLHTLYERPNLNRFVAGRRLYEHNDFDVSYVVKKTLTDDAEESIAHVSLNEHDTIFTVSERMMEHIKNIEEGEIEKSDDKLMAFVMKFPRWAIRSIVNIVRWMDFHGILPKSFQDIIPLYSSVFISHIGSLGAEAPFHHLYEFGTTSIFITIGKVYEVPSKGPDGGVIWNKCVDFMFTVDERICDGVYLVNSMKRFVELLENPVILESSPVENEIEKRYQAMDKKYRVSEPTGQLDRGLISD